MVIKRSKPYSHYLQEENIVNAPIQHFLVKNLFALHPMKFANGVAL